MATTARELAPAPVIWHCATPTCRATLGVVQGGTVYWRVRVKSGVAHMEACLPARRQCTDCGAWNDWPVASLAKPRRM